VASIHRAAAWQVWIRCGWKLLTVFAPVFLATGAGLGVLILDLHGPAWLPWLGLVPAAGVAALAMRPEPRGAPPPSGADALLTLAIVLAALVWAWTLFGPGVLPIGDPVAVPQFARSLATGLPLTEAFPPGSSGHAYPPGYPLLFAPAEAVLQPDTALMLFKLVTVAVAALIPAAWGGLHRALFAPDRPAWQVAALAYVAFILLERQLGFLTPFAGKNAVEFALLLFPAVILATIRLAERPRLWPLAALPLGGLFVIHYSMLHLAAAFLAAYALLGRPWRWGPVLRMVGAGAIACGLLLLAAGEALHDPRAAAAPWTLGPALGLLARAVVASRPPLVIFHDAAFGLTPAYYRILVVAACGAVAVALGFSLRRPGLWRAAMLYGLALAASLAFGYGVVPARINLDFVRCFAWTLQAALFLVAMLALVEGWGRLAGSWRWAAPLAAAPVLAVALAIAWHDMRVERAAFRQATQPRAAIHQIAAALPQDRACMLIAHGQARPDVLVTIQDAPPWNYAEALSPCVFVGGSWVHAGWPGGRDLDGLPSAEALRRLPAGLPVYFVGPRAQLDAYAGALAGQGLGWAWRPAGQAAGSALWRAERPSGSYASNAM